MAVTVYGKYALRQQWQGLSFFSFGQCDSLLKKYFYYKSNFMTPWRWGFSPAINPGLKPQLHRLSLATTIVNGSSCKKLSINTKIYKLGRLRVSAAKPNKQNLLQPTFLEKLLI
jgi:hypothetical protein